MLKSLLSFFHDQYNMQYDLVEPNAIPEPNKELLVHGNHMTATLENFYSQNLQVKIHKDKVTNEEYKRIALLWLPNIGVVELGIVFMDLSAFSKDICSEILEGKKPLGKILTEHKEPRNIKVGSFFKIQNNPMLEKVFESPSSYLYGRTTIISCKVPIHVVEILCPR